MSSYSVFADIEKKSEKTKSLPLVEVCCDSYASVVNAIEGGARRIELCSGLEVDGLTPSCGLLARVCHLGQVSNVPINVLIRAGVEILCTPPKK